MAAGVGVLADELDELGPREVLAGAGQVLRDRRSVEVRDVGLALRWADLHSSDPQEEPGVLPAAVGGNHLVELGGVGTPGVQELCLHELAVARRCHVNAVRVLVADGLDLRHRLPLVWCAVRELECDLWVARKVAFLTRGLTHVQAGLVDRAVAEAIGGLSPGRVLALAEAKVIEADTAAHEARVAEQLRQRRVSFSRTDDVGLRTLCARLEAGDAVWIDATIDRVADLLAADPGLRRRHHPDLPDDVGKEELRAVALGWLARPDDLAALLGVTDDTDSDSGTDAGGEHRPVLKQQAVVYVHLHEAALFGTPGVFGEPGETSVARAEGIGPLLVSALQRLLGHAEVELRPVIDLADRIHVASYEHPEKVKERSFLRSLGEVFPHASGGSRRVDHDHVRPWRATGPPGQTGDHNTAPLRRGSHRAKTHLGYSVEQVDLTTYRWRTPHGLRRVVDHTGTRDVPDDQAPGT